LVKLSSVLEALAGIEFPYRDIGKCIYCGSTAPPLTREHVLPKGLGGRHSPDGHHEAIVLRNASCMACQKITQSFESDCLIDNFGLTRQRKGLRDRRRNSNQYKQTVDLGDGIERKLTFDPKDLTAVIMMPLLEPAGFLTGRSQNSLLDVELRGIVTHTPQSGVNPLPVGARAGYKVNLFAFYRMLAKIAHGFAVARYGLGAFEPNLLGTILGTSRAYGMWIGSTDEETTATPVPGKLTQIRLREVAIDDENKTAIIAWIRLFPEFKTPEYHVLVGTIDIPFEERKRLFQGDPNQAPQVKK
jgi:hypothetical protein